MCIRSRKGDYVYPACTHCRLLFFTFVTIHNRQLTGKGVYVVCQHVTHDRFCYVRLLRRNSYRHSYEHVYISPLGYVLTFPHFMCCISDEYVQVCCIVCMMCSRMLTLLSVRLRGKGVLFRIHKELHAFIDCVFFFTWCMWYVSPSKVKQVVSYMGYVGFKCTC